MCSLEVSQKLRWFLKRLGYFIFLLRVFKYFVDALLLFLKDVLKIKRCIDLKGTVIGREEERDGEKKGQREGGRNSVSAGPFLSGHNNQGLSRMKPGVPFGSLIWVTRDPSAWPVLCCLLRCIDMELNKK